MPAPTNTSPATAIDITGLPYSSSQTVDFGGTTYTVYYKRMAQAGETAYGLWFFGDLVTYQPSVLVVDANDVAMDFGEGASVQAGGNEPCQHAVVPGVTYYYRVPPNAGNPTPATLTVSALLGASAIAPAGSPFINEDSGTYPAVIFDTTQDNTPLQFKYPFAGGESSAVFSDGTGLYSDIGGVAGDPAFAQLYNGLLQLQNAQVIDFTYGESITCNNVNFYVGFVQSTAYSVKAVSKAGVVGATVASAMTSRPLAIAVNPAGTILYFVKNGGSSASGSYAIGRWDLSLNIAMSDLAAAVAGKNTCQHEILCLSDGRVVVAYSNQANPFAASINVYNADGTTYASYSVTGAAGGDQRLATAEDDPTSFVIYTNNIVDSVHRTVRKLTTATGVAVWNITTTVFNKGGSTATPSATPVRWGHANSCPVTVLRQSPIPTQATDPIRVVRRWQLPFETNLQVFLSRLEILIQSGVGLTAGPSGSPVQGEDPTIMLRISKDGGKTWGNEQWRGMGKIGEYLARPYWNRLGRGRNIVAEIVCTDPVFVAFLDAFVDAEVGSS